MTSRRTNRDIPSYELPAEVHNLFQSAVAAGYVLTHGSRKSWITLNRRKVGGWDDRLECWYVSKVLARDYDELMRANNFQWQDNKNGHEWWRRSGAHNGKSFQTVVETITEQLFRSRT